MAEYQNYYDYDYHMGKKEDAAEVKKIRESFRNNFPPNLRRQIEQELEQDNALDSAPVVPDGSQLTFSRLESLFPESSIPKTYSSSYNYWYTTPKFQPELVDATDVDFS